MKIKNIQNLNFLIKSESTGSAAELGQKLGISQRMTFKYLEIIKDQFKAPVKYDKSRKTYFFDGNGELDLNWRDQNKK